MVQEAKITVQAVEERLTAAKVHYGTQIDQLTGKGAGFSKRQATDLKAGFDDGVAAVWPILRALGVIS